MLNTFIFKMGASRCINYSVKITKYPPLPTQNPKYLKIIITFSNNISKSTQKSQLIITAAL
jgi:hypothetical protein